MKVLITGAAGNLGGLLTNHLIENTAHDLNLLIHKTEVSDHIKDSQQVSVFKGDLAEPRTLAPCLEDIDTVIHFAGVLFRGRPEQFLPETNTEYFRNLCDAAAKKNVRRIILISFPHVEGETAPDNPAVGKLDRSPSSMHARTRLEEEQYLFNELKGIETVSLRVGMVYGKGILMIDAAHWLSKRHLLGIWRKPTWVHLISKDDFLSACTAAIEQDNISGIYHIGDEGTQTLQDFLAIAVEEWGTSRPWVMPAWMIYTAAFLCEVQSLCLGTKAPLTRDFIRIGMASYYGDTASMRKDLLPELKYKDINSGRETL